ncbi:MAG: DUF4157 domain-containing protein [Rhodoferax sp.]|nr:DUF4157 domain-containing protein [Rhodoferax sp.]
MSRALAMQANAVATGDTGAVLLQRRCACGQGASELTGACDDCQRERLLGLQARLAIGASDDPLEIEADRAAARVLRPDVARTDPSRDAPLALTRRSSVPAAAHQAAAPASVHQTLARAGEPLAPATRAFFEPRFGHDFGKVRVHRDALAARSAREVQAQAYTVGHAVVFGSGQYDPHSIGGKALLAHELAHVVQQSAASPRTVQRAVVRQGALSIHIDYGPVVLIPDADRADHAIGQIAAFTGAPPPAAQETAIRALTADAQKWLMFALTLVSDNIAAASTLDRGVATQRLVDHAGSALHVPQPDPARAFVREAMRVSGWSETAQAQRLSAPVDPDLSAIDTIVNPPPSTGAIGDPLDAAALNARLPPALTHLLTTLDPAGRANVGTRSLSAFQAIGDVVQTEARSFFAPYADAAIGNLYDLQPAWHASANIFDVGTLTPNAAQRRSYLSNRAEIIGRSDTTSSIVNDANIFADVHFESTRATDRAELAGIVATMEADPAIAPVVDRLIQHTGRKTGTASATRIGLVTDFDADQRSACADHWVGIDTLCHEVLHALVHPDFVATAGRVAFPQVIREGFTEVLGVQLFNDRIVPKANADAAFKTTLETGVTGAPCPAPVAATIGYGSAGSGAEDIRTRVHDDNFRAAYFLGRPELAGLPP